MGTTVPTFLGLPAAHTLRNVHGMADCAVCAMAWLIVQSVL